MKGTVKFTVKFCGWNSRILGESAQHCDSQSAVESDTQSDTQSVSQSAVSDTQSVLIIAESAVVWIGCFSESGFSGFLGFAGFLSESRIFADFADERGF